MRRILIVAVASSLATAAVIAATGIARSGNDDSKSGPPPTMAQALKEHQAQRDERLGRIAKRLDISTDKLKDAIEKVRTQELDDLVKQGKLTDAERDAILACRQDPLKCDRSNLPAPRFERHFYGGRGRGLHLMRRDGDVNFFADLAKELGKDEKQVRDAFLAELPRFESGPRMRSFRGPGGAPPPPPDPDSLPAPPDAPGSFDGPGFDTAPA